MHICTLCQGVYKSIRLLKEHFRATHPNEKQSVRSQKQKNGGEANLRHMCEYCGYRTRLSCNLVVHKRRHTGEKPYSCDKCGKTFVARYQLVRHWEIHIDDQRRRNKHKCGICGAGFLSSRALYHHRPLHAPCKKFVCQLCSKAYAQSAGYAQHKRWHRTQNERTTRYTQNVPTAQFNEQPTISILE